MTEQTTQTTFDAFTKSLVDRFFPVIPADWRPSRPYEIAFPTFRQVTGFLQEELLNTPREWKAQVASLGATNFESHHVGAYRLPIARAAPNSGVERTIQRWWEGQLEGRSHSRMTFISLNRLAELLLRACPHIRRALQVTFPFIFVDEFQDTTYAQYDFLLSAFSGAGIAITAVGDYKQRIMTWAGARPDAFERFEADFAATRIPLLFNFRSSPDLVRIQHIIARALDPHAADTVAQAAQQVDGDVAQIWNSRTIARECAHLANWLAHDMAARGQTPRDYAILVKQKSDDFEVNLAAPFAQEGLRLRNESRSLGRTTLQDLLTDSLARIVVALLRLGASRRMPDAWQHSSAALLDIRAVASSDVTGAARVEEELTAFVTALRVDMARTPPSGPVAESFAGRIFQFLDLIAVGRTFIEYATGELLAIMVDAFKRHIAISADGAADWGDCLNAFEGIEQIPLMTVHKSKGLEYDTIVFVGLDDQAWWAHQPGNPEGLATFFVALSRAKQRAIFAFCRERGPRQRVAELFQLLTEAGVPEIAL